MASQTYTLTNRLLIYESSLILSIGMVNFCSAIFLLKIQKFYWGSVFISELICKFYEL